MRRRVILFLMASLLAPGILALQGCYVAGAEYGYGGGYPVYAGYGGGPSYDYDGSYPVYDPALGVLTTMRIMIEMIVSMPGLRLAAAIVPSAEAAQSTHSAPAHMRAVMVAVEA